MSPLPLALAALLLAGCAASPTDEKSSQNQQSCTKVNKVGSNIPIHDCATKAQ